MNTDSPFNPDAFMDLEVQGALDTKVIPVPVGEWPAQIGELTKPRVVAAKDGSETYVFFEVPWKVTDPNVVAACGRDNPTVRQSISLDITANGTLDMGKGKNVGLGQLRDVLGMNDPSAPFNVRMLQGRGAIIKVTHRNDPKDATKVFVDAKPIRAI